jgi:hypothetical protein
MTAINPRVLNLKGFPILPAFRLKRWGEWRIAPGHPKAKVPATNRAFLEMLGVEDFATFNLWNAREVYTSPDVRQSCVRDFGQTDLRVPDLAAVPGNRDPCRDRSIPWAPKNACSRLNPVPLVFSHDFDRPPLPRTARCPR